MTQATITVAPGRKSRSFDFKAFWKRFAAAYEIYQNKVARMDQVAELQAKSDRQLADMGIRREDIALIVYRDTAFF